MCAWAKKIDRDSYTKEVGIRHDEAIRFHSQAISEMTTEIMARTEVGVLAQIIYENCTLLSNEDMTTQDCAYIAEAIQKHIRQGLEGKK